ncbi:MAG: DUF1501 domain-containing protein [Planctomycetes bacterium]|nr:DUF1501 domain-containing protein [Planctomycetota bacterium]MCH9727080.1 DUF1501 domain-containing protein [Planctomycetota bacterium]MCH9775023.1 DUF1501 domain-containing protein [Planctomycetota bacterium]MCH9792082.1 DUF1501 domain-containing protein [Planctomycetota bacterium]MDF1744432.1 DUF1501 domain-containing protein [Gimesia sp.]
MRCDYACGTHEGLSRRSFIGGASAGALSMLGFNGMTEVQASKKLASQQKQVVVFWLSGGVSQLETWDPKPGTETGGPFLSIPTSAPGVQISELLPHTAQQMHHLALVRGINTKENDHGKGGYIMQTGRKKQPGFAFPYLGSTFSSHLSSPDSPLPGYISVGAGGSSSESTFLGPRHAPLVLSGGRAPSNLELHKSMQPDRDQMRRKLRNKISRRFEQKRKTAHTEVYNESFDQAAALMSKRDVFDFSKFSDKDVERYGKHDFGRHCLMARQLIEKGVTFVKVGHTNYDTHSENFNFHIEQLGEFDKPFATFISDLYDRGLLEHTLIICMCEFGRTPRINSRIGRDHWGTAWSVALGGTGIKGGAVSGKTNETGTKVIDREVNGGHLFHTYYQAVGLDSTEEFYPNGQPIAKADPKAEPIKEILV